MMDADFTSLLATPIALLLMTVAVAVLFFKTKRRSVTNPPPGPRGWEALRCVLSALRRGDLHTHAETWNRRYGELVLCRSILGDMCFLNSARLVRKVFAGKEVEAFTNNRPKTFTGWILCDYKDVVTSDSDQFPEWFKLRKILHRALKLVSPKHVFQFYGDGVDHMESVIQAEVHRLVTELKTTSGQDVDMGLTLSNSLISVVAVLMSGEHYQPGSQQLRALKKLDDCINEIFNPVTDSTLAVFPWLRFVPLLRYKSLCDDVISAREEVFSYIVTDVKKTHVSGKPRGVIDVLLDEQSKGENSWMTDVNIKGLMINMTAAAYITSLQTLKAAFLYIIHDPEVMRRVQKEIDENIGERPPCLEDRSNLPFTEAVILETLRHSSIVALGVAHEASDDVTVDGYTIPKGTQILTNSLGFHHDPEVFPDPERFLPGRFLDDSGDLLQATHPLRQSLLPFGFGKRSCPGEAFARSRVFLYITTLLQKFDVLPPANHQLLPDSPSSWATGGSLELKPYHLIFRPRS